MTIISIPLALFLAYSLVQGQTTTDCATVLQIFKALGGVTTATNGCLIPGVTSSNGVVTSIIWRNQGLRNSIPSSIGNFRSLQHLVLENNQISGPIPIDIGKLTNLQSLYLQGNQLSGSIPTEIGKLTLLKHLWLQKNQLTGSIPRAIGSLTQLTMLFLWQNKLSGTIPPEIGNLLNLSWLCLFNNQLSGFIPTEMGRLTALQIIQLHQNQLTGAPTSLSAIKAPTKVLFPNPMSTIPYDVFAQNPAGVLSATNWTNLMNTRPSRKRQSTSSVSVDELYAMCPLNNVQSADVASGCVAGIYNKFCLNLSNLGPCHKAYDDVVAASIFRPLGICAAWKSGPKSATCVSLIASFRVDLGYIVLTSTNANNFVRTIFGSTTYSPCVNTPLVKCTW